MDGDYRYTGQDRRPSGDVSWRRWKIQVDEGAFLQIVGGKRALKKSDDVDIGSRVEDAVTKVLTDLGKMGAIGKTGVDSVTVTALSDRSGLHYEIKVGDDTIKHNITDSVLDALIKDRDATGASKTVKTFFSSRIGKMRVKVNRLLSWLRPDKAGLPIKFATMTDVIGAVPEDGRLTMTQSFDVMLAYLRREAKADRRGGEVAIMEGARKMAKVLDEFRSKGSVKGRTTALNTMIKGVQKR